MSDPMGHDGCKRCEKKLDQNGEYCDKHVEVSNQPSSNGEIFGSSCIIMVLLDWFLKLEVL